MNASHQHPAPFPDRRPPRRTRRALARWAAWLLVLATPLWSPLAAASGVGLLAIDGALGPANADHVVRGIERAAAQGQQLLILRIDTPGGLDTAMRAVIRSILASPVPVAAYVAPSGARAASAGTYLLYASHVAAMAPGTNVGAATPVEIGLAPQQGAQGERDARRQDADGGQDTASRMGAKQLNDAAAYLRGLAQLRGRNAEWAERAVRESVSLTADEALRQNVIDYVAVDVPALLAQLEGHSVTVLGQQRRLATKGAAIVEYAPDWRTSLLAAITNPSVALLLMTIGIYALVFEFMNPGALAPGVIGGICLLLGLYALQLLPVNHAGLALVVLGLAFMCAEAFLPSFGILGIGGIAAFVVGGLILVDTDLPGYGIPPGVVGTLAIASAAVLFGTVRLALKTRERPVTSGAEGLVGALGSVEKVAQEDARQGWVRVQGELWHAVGGLPLMPDQVVRIVGRRGLTLSIAPVDKP